MKRNKVTYQEAISMLKDKVHQAPYQWERLESELKMKEEMTSLQIHKAPDNIWAKIESDLDVEMPQRKRSSYRKMMFGLIVCMVLMYSVIQFFISEGTSNTFVYNSEVEIIDSELPEIETNSLAYETGIRFIELNEETFSEEKYSAYQKEINELEIAIEAMKMMQEEYGQDAASLKMLSRLEREKAELIKSMVNRA